MQSQNLKAKGHIQFAMGLLEIHNSFIKLASVILIKERRTPEDCLKASYLIFMLLLN